MLLLVALAGLVAGACSTPTPTPVVTLPPTQPPEPTGTMPPCEGGTGAAEAISIELTENPYKFRPNAFDFKVCTTYALTFSVPGELHTFTVDDLDLDISISAGETVVFEFTPTQAGTFRLICLPHEALGMVGGVRVR